MAIMDDFSFSGREDPGPGKKQKAAASRTANNNRLLCREGCFSERSSSTLFPETFKLAI